MDKKAKTGTTMDKKAKTGTTMDKKQRLVPQWIKNKDSHHNG
jgi:hypothetical protein